MKRLLVMLVAAAAGCGGGGAAVKPAAAVTGKVSVNKQPLSGASVIFIPVSGGGQTASARTGSDGAFNVPGGLPPGDYKVVFSLRVGPEGLPVPEGKSPNEPGIKELLPTFISNPGESRVLTTIEAGKPAELNFPLTAPGVKLP